MRFVPHRILRGLQYHPRQEGNTLFLNEEMEPFPDQWGFLTSLPQGCLDDVRTLLQEYKSRLEVEDTRNLGDPVDVRFLGELFQLKQSW